MYFTFVAGSESTGDQRAERMVRREQEVAECLQGHEMSAPHQTFFVSDMHRLCEPHLRCTPHAMQESNHAGFAQSIGIYRARAGGRTMAQLKPLLNGLSLIGKAVRCQHGLDHDLHRNRANKLIRRFAIIALLPGALRACKMSITGTVCMSLTFLPGKHWRPTHCARTPGALSRGPR